MLSQVVSIVIDVSLGALAYRTAKKALVQINALKGEVEAIKKFLGLSNE
jgi:hypothetical protein